MSVSQSTCYRVYEHFQAAALKQNLPLESPAFPSQPVEKTVNMLKKSKLLARGGYRVVPGLMTNASLAAMFNEATQLIHSAREELREEQDTEEWRGGMPPRKLLTVGGGPAQDWLYHAPAFQALLSELVGVQIKASSGRGSYSYYCRPGDYLGLHRDVDQCDISVIISISDNTDVKQQGGELIVFPQHIDSPLSTVRKRPEEKGQSIKLTGGDTCILAGGMVPHFVRPVAKDQYRITAPMCFEVVV